MATSPNPDLTPQQYLEIERSAESRSEYVDGEMFAMSGASERHVLIVTNLVREISQKLRKGPCRVYSTDMRVWLPLAKRFVYPDLAITCANPIFMDGERDTLTNPETIIEVLSPSTSNYDRGDKFAAYRTIPRLNEYITVAQHEIHLEQHIRIDGGWKLVDHVERSGTFEFQSLGIKLLLADIYESIEIVC